MAAPSTPRPRRRRSRSSISITNWSYAHPRSIELAERIAELTPGDLNRVFFTNSGSEAVEAAIKVARNYHRALGKGQKHKIIAREVAYHGTTMGALAATGLTGLKTPFEPYDARRASMPPTPTSSTGPTIAIRSGRPSRSAT